MWVMVDGLEVREEIQHESQSDLDEEQMINKCFFRGELEFRRKMRGREEERENISCHKEEKYETVIRSEQNALTSNCLMHSSRFDSVVSTLNHAFWEGAQKRCDHRHRGNKRQNRRNHDTKRQMGSQGSLPVQQ